MASPLLVFISSAIAGMSAERQAAQAAVQAIPISRPRLFEFSPASSLPLEESYLSQVRACDLIAFVPESPILLPAFAPLWFIGADHVFHYRYQG